MSLALLCGAPSITCDGRLRSTTSEEAARRRTISLAKQVLAEACALNPTAVHKSSGLGLGPAALPLLPSASSPSKHDPLRNTEESAGALGSLLVLLQGAACPDKARCVLDTISFLLLDRANRKAVHDLGGLHAILACMQRHDDPRVRMSGLEAVVGLVKHDDREKARLWRCDDARCIVSLLGTQNSTPQLLEALRLIRLVAFTSDGTSPCSCSSGDSVPVPAPRLLAPCVLPAVAGLLQQHGTAPIGDGERLLQQCLALLADAAARSAWRTALSTLAELLAAQQPLCEQQHHPRSSSSSRSNSPPPAMAWSLLDSALQPLLALSDHPAFRDVLFDANCVPPLLGLLRHPADSAKVTAACVLANLTDSPPCREQMSREEAVLCVLNALLAATCSETAVGLLYILSSLSATSAAVVAVLGKWGAVPLTLKMQYEDEDEDVVRGLQQLLDLIHSSLAVAQGHHDEAELAAAAAPPKMSSTVSAPAFVDLELVAAASHHAHYAAAGRHSAASSCGRRGHNLLC